MTEKATTFGKIKDDVSASLVVFLVAVPLCLGIAMASGAPLISGLIAGIIGGLLVSSVSQSALGVSGPAAGLAVIVLSAIQELGSFPVFLCAVVLAGILQIVMGVLKAGFISYFFPTSLVKGMLAGIGIIIILKQIPHAVGYDKVFEGSLSFFQADGFNSITELFNLTSVLSPGPLLISLTGLAILIAWEQPALKRIPILGGLPAPLLAVGAGIGLQLLFASSDTLKLASDQLVSIPVLQNYADASSLLVFPEWSAFLRFDVITIAVIMALVASIETLLCLEATDELDPLNRVSPANRELIAQGMGNVASGLIGGLPVTQVIVRSSSNIVAGGRSKLSAILHGLWLLISLLFVPTLINMIPLASLAAILLTVGYKLASPKLLREMLHQTPEQAISFYVTVLGLVFTDLLTGIALGFAVSVLAILWTNYRHPFFSDPDLSHPEDGLHIRFAEDVSFLNKAGLMRMLSHLPDDLRVVLDCSRTRRMHPDIDDVIEDFLVNAESRNIAVDYIRMPKYDDRDHEAILYHMASARASSNRQKTTSS